MIAVLLLVILVRHRAELFRDTAWRLGLTAVVLLGLSVMADIAEGRLLVMDHDWQTFIEDGLKLFGIVSWLGFAWATAARWLSRPTPEASLG